MRDANARKPRRFGKAHFIGLVCVFLAAAATTGLAKKQEHQWSVGKILDENRARYFAGMLHNSSSNTTERGNWDGSANSTSVGDSTNTEASGTYSGASTTSTSGFSTPVYRVYDDLVVEGSDDVYFTSERLRWRWSKGAHVTVNDTVKYYVEGRKIHVLDSDGKEHIAEIVKEIRKPQANSGSALPPQIDKTPPANPSVALTATDRALVTIDSTPPGADIEIDGAFVGNTPSTVPISSGNHRISVRRKGFADWTKTLNVTGGSIHLNAELEQAAPSQ